MKFEPRTVSGNINVTPGHPLKDFIDLWIRIIGALLIVYFILGWAVDVLVVNISPAFEDKLAEALTTQFNKSPPTELETYITDLSNKMAFFSDQLQGRRFTVHIMPGKEPNAFAWPGGNIVLTSSLFHAVKSENELSMVLGHELGHYARRDHLRGLGRGLIFLAMSVVVFGADSQLSNPLANVISSTEMNYSRSQESAADLYGINLLYKMYGHVGGAYAFFEYDKVNNKLPWLQFGSSHPSSESRTDALKEFSRAKHWPDQGLKAFPPHLSEKIKELSDDKT